MNIGIVGCGFIGSALKNWLSKHNSSCRIFVSDPPKGLNDNLQNCDIIFISLHIPTETDGSQDLSLLKQIVSGLPDVPIFIRTTVLPGTCDRLSAELNRDISFMPEFLTQRTADEDFARQTMIFTKHEDLLKQVFIGKKYILMSSREAETAKYVHNVFSALKVTFFNGVYEYCRLNKCSYQSVLKGVLSSGYINDTHTAVPGPDGKKGYGGKCFPKDVNAFLHALDGASLKTLLSPLPSLNEHYREGEK